MKIIHIVAGAGEMYCGSCLHTNTLAAALREAGQDVLLAPVYMPLRTDEENLSTDRVAFGGINVYLGQQSALFRHLPRPLARLLDRPGLLRWLSKHSGGTRPERLGPLTISVLQGEQGRQRGELEKLVRWLEEEVRPEVVHLSNVMLCGMARQLASRLRVPIVCSLSGEDIFLEKLPEPYYSQARELLRERCGDIDVLMAMNNYYADFMADYLDVPRSRVRVIPPGLSLRDFEADDSATRTGLPDETVTIGYLARICPEKGLHNLAQAFALLAAEKDLPPIRLSAAGYLERSERSYLAGIKSQLAAAGLLAQFEYIGEVNRAEKVAFLRSLDVMSVPTVYRESKGLSVLEAWAAGVPVVLPKHGAFPELVADTGGGLLCEAENPAALAAALRRMIVDRSFAQPCGRKACEAVRQRYNGPLMARRTLQLYREICSK
jgi:glycosyltransferase involved in cell wall biosynthesis